MLQPYVGDWVGLQYNVDPKTCKIMPLPDHTVPQSLLDWGQVPLGSEVITSTELPTSLSPALTSQTLTISSEVGCGTDSLPFTVTTTTTPSTQSHYKLLPDSTILISKPLPPSTKGRGEKITTTFLDTHTHKESTLVTLELDRMSTGSLTSIRVLRQNRVDPTPSLAVDITRSKTLDSRTLIELMGDLSLSALGKLKPPLLRHLTKSAWSRCYPQHGNPLPCPGVFTYSDADYGRSLRLPSDLVVTSTPTALSVSRLQRFEMKEGARKFEKTTVIRTFDKRGKVCRVQHWREERKEKRDNEWRDM